MKRSLFILLAAAAAWMALISTAFACNFSWYEPEVPDVLRERA
ncbi:MAG: AgrD family cyclic lactone autoinducer peptide [Bacillota bacterium]